MEKPKYEVPKELIIPASEHPKAFEGPTLILNIIIPPSSELCLPSFCREFPSRSARNSAACTVRT